MKEPWLQDIEINKKEKRAIYLQIADLIINLIKQNKLRANEPVASSRQISEQLKVNRNTVVKALDFLQLEGWLYSLERKGVFVSDLKTKEIRRVLPTDTVIDNTQVAIIPQIVFDDGLPDTRLAPIDELARAYRQIFRRKAKWKLMDLDNSLGCVLFRGAIAQMLNQDRRIHVDPSQICITRGSQMALFLIAQHLFRTGDLVLVENPGFRPMWDAFEHAGAELLPIDVDKQGIVIEEVEQIVSKRKVKAIYITPHHQYPTTVTLSLERRLRLIELSNKYGFIIIEDDYDNEFHFSQRPPMPVMALEGAKNCIYIGTFSKLIAPSIRVGFLVADTKLVSQIGDLRRLIDIQGDNIMEQAVLELINTGVIRKHKRRVVAQYKSRYEHFTKLIDLYLKDKVKYYRPDGGLALWLEFKEARNIDELLSQIPEQKVKIISPAKYSLGGITKGIRLGYASLSEEELERGVKLLSKYI